MADDQASSQSGGELDSAISAVQQNPRDRSRWERVEELLESTERKSEVSALLQAVMTSSLSSDLVTEIGQRGVRFYESWYGEDSVELASWLDRVLAADPKALWAFERLTVAHTVGERWTQLLDAYDRAIAAADQTSRRMRLLEEAAQVAKDFASQPERAIGYMLKLHALDPDNSTLAAGLERLLERQERWEDLVALWKSRLGLQSAKQAREARVRMASCYLDKLGRYGDALEQSKLVLADAPDHEAAYAVLERVLCADRAGAAERREALALLKQRYDDAHRPEDGVRVLELGLSYEKDSERRSLLHELTERLSALGDDTRAMRHQAALLVLEPTLRERDALRELAERTRDHALYASALIEAAERSEQPTTAAELRMQAARTLEQAIGDERGACELYQRVFAGSAPLELVADAGRRLLPLLEQLGDERGLLVALARMGEIESNPTARKPLLGQMARLAEKLGDRERAEEAWQTRLREDAHDLDALEALLASAAEQQQWTRLCELLEQRIAAPGAEGDRRKDLIWLASTFAERIGDLNTAIAVWQRLEAGFGQDLESVQALTDLLSRAERWSDLAEVLSQAAARQITRFTELQTRLGDAYRQKLDRPELAAERYRSALQVEPRDGTALRGQHELMADERCRAIAVSSLVDAYARTGEWQKTLELLEARLSIETAAARRSEILIESARLYEQRAKDERGALACLRRAFAQSPDDRATEREIRRLAERQDAWDAVVAAYRETIASFSSKTPRVAELRFDEGTTLETRLSDLQGAHTAFAEAAALAPERVEFALAAARTAARTARWETAARHALDCMAARSGLEESLLETLESTASEMRGWDALAEAVTLGLRSSALRLSSELARELHARVAIWHKSMRRDDEAAEASLLRAVAADGRHAPTLIALADIQRRKPSEALCDTLLALYELDPNNLDPLLEAADVAREAIADADKLLAIWQRLFDRAADLLRQGKETRGEASAAHCARWALEQLVGALSSTDPERAYGLLVAAGALRFDAEIRREDLHRAARLCAVQLKDPVRAMALYRDLLQADPLDRDAMRELAAVYRSADRLPELLMLRRHELSLERSEERQLELRLEIASLLGEMEERGGRAQALLENLRARPGHASTLAAVSELYTAQARHGEHAELLRKQAELLAKHAETERAAQLLQRAAVIYERELGNADAAIGAYRELYELDPAGESTAALARLYGARGDHAQAARWLELRLGTVPPDTRAITGVELGQALLEAGQRDRARACLEQALRDDAGQRDARTLLAELYREDSAFEPLAGLLTEAAAHERDAGVRLALLTEAASIYCDTLRAPERGLSALERAAELAPQDRLLQIKYAEVLSACAHHDRARAVYERLIEGYGRKRSPERAELHYRVARTAQAAGDMAQAFEQLETATKMDLAHVPAMHMLADLSREQGDLDRAERTYRGLLMLVRRHKPTDLQAVGPSEIFFALGSIADARGQKQQADELLESAMEAASQSEAEARRFQELLRKRGQTDLLMRVLDVRMKLAQDATAEADVLATKAEVLETLGQPKEALTALLAAIGLTPDADALHDKARKLGRAQRALDRYLERVGEIADEAGRRKDEQSQKLSARLILRQGEAIERDLSDLDRAAGLYAKVESSGHHVIDAWLAIARVAGARGDSGEQRRVLQRIEELGNDRVSAEQRREVLFQLVEIELGNDAWRDAGVATLERAIEGLTDYERAKSVLRAAIERAPKHEKLSALFERVARSARDQAMLLEHFERRATRKGAPAEELREGVELALRLSEYARAERMLKRMLKAGDGDAEKTSWVYARLSECRARAGDMAGAIAYLSQAADRAEGDDAAALYRELARVAGGEGGDLEVASTAYMRLLERDRGDRSAWQPLLGVYLKMGDAARFESCAQELIAQLPLAADRVAVHMMRARFLLDVVRDERAAVPVLKTLLEEDPSHREATDLLTQILQKQGMNEELAQLLQVHFDRARDEQNLPAIAELGLRIAELYGERHPDQAIDALRFALNWVPEHAGLLRALLERMGPAAEARERAEVMQSLLAIERGDEAARLALQLSAMWAELGEVERAQQALELGIQHNPEHGGLRDRLESFYAERQMWRPLGELLERQAERLGATPEAVGRLKNAASLYRDQLQDLDAAASALRKALAIVPEDLSLLGELARNLAATGQHRTAIEDVTRILTEHPQAGVVHADLLKVRAELRLAVEEVEAAVGDLEQAYALDAGTTRGALIDALERLKTTAFTRGEADVERTVVMRLLELHDATSDHDAAREVLSGWVEQSPEDAEALRSLRERDMAARRWQDVVRTCERLLNIDTGKARTATAIALADAYAMDGNPAGARGALERAHKEDPRDSDLRTRLRALYETIGAHAELAGILLADAYAIKDTEDRVALLQRTARLYLQAGDPGAALGPLGEAAKLQPDDSESQLLMIDISIQLGKLPHALQALESAIAAQKRRRSPELAQLYQRMARVSVAQGDSEEQLKWLNQAAEIDRKSAEIASELAEAALAAENYDMAMKALRALTMMDDPRPITRALAFLKQAQIAHLRGDPRRAQHWARKAKSLDDSLSEADTFLAEIGG